MQTPNALAPEVQEFQNVYLAELDGRVQRSEVVGLPEYPVGAKTFEQGSATLFFEALDGKFTLVQKLQDMDEGKVFDCVPREQWGRTVMLFGHATNTNTNTGGYSASGHGTLNDKMLRIKLASGHMYRMDVDPALAHLQPFVQEKPQPRTHERPTQHGAHSCQYAAKP